MKVSLQNTEHYFWGDGCEGWHFLKSSDLSVIVEKMLPGTSEKKHKHSKSRQFFFILIGVAEIWLDGQTHVLSARQGLEIPGGAAHQIFNRTSESLEFILVSSPPAQSDRTDLD